MTGTSTRKQKTPKMSSPTAKHRIRSFIHRKTNEMFAQNQALISYVTEQEYSKNKKMIELFLKKQPPQTLTLYRGHMDDKEIRKNTWYSTSKSKKVAREEFAGKNCCVFVIHVVNVPVLDVNKLVQNKIGEYAEEQEIIVLGGGTFYQDKTMMTPGFRDAGDGEYVCWYSLDKPKKMKKNTPTSAEKDIIKRFVDQIPEEEYEFIANPSDIVISGISDVQRQKVYDEIQKKINV